MKIKSHDEKFAIEEEEPEVMTEEQIKESNIIVKNGLRFNKETGQLMPLTKRAMQLKF